MATVNKVVLIGRVSREPELRYLPDGKAVASFGVATDRGRGESKETDFHNISVFGKAAGDDGIAGSVAEHVVKGMLVYVEGRLQYRKWEKEGQKRESTDIVAHSVQFLSRKKEE